MPGLWLTRVAQRFTRRDTFERLVSPAIADLQIERDARWGARAGHYFALTAVIACALVRDFRTDVALAFDADARRNIWLRAALW
jgi:hypothetical protein